jgi:hypothetical protein
MAVVPSADGPAAAEDVSSRAAALASAPGEFGKRVGGPEAQVTPRNEAPRPAEPGTLLFVGAQWESPSITHQRSGAGAALQDPQTD